MEIGDSCSTILRNASHELVTESKGERELWHGTIQPTLKQGLQIRNLSFAFGSTPVLQNVSLDIPANQITVIIGASGAGKTTLTDLLLGLYQPDEGRILIDSVPLEEIDIQAWRGMVGYVPQELMLFHDTILANITLGDRSVSIDQATVSRRKTETDISVPVQVAEVNLIRFSIVMQLPTPYGRFGCPFCFLLFCGNEL